MIRVPLRFALDEPEAIALAQFLKRVGWTEWRAAAVDDHEAYLIRDACTVVQRELERAGYAPR